MRFDIALECAGLQNNDFVQVVAPVVVVGARDHVHVPADLGACGRRCVTGGVVGEDQVVLRVGVAEDAEGDAVRNVDAVLLGQLAHGARRVLLQLLPEAGVDERLEVDDVPYA